MSHSVKVRDIHREIGREREREREIERTYSPEATHGLFVPALSLSLHGPGEREREIIGERVLVAVRLGVAKELTDKLSGEREREREIGSEIGSER